jgi:hypothetical protein
MEQPQETQQTKNTQEECVIKANKAGTPKQRTQFSTQTTHTQTTSPKILNILVELN